MIAKDRELAEHFGKEKTFDFLRQMLRIRRFEERAGELYTETKIRGFLHLYIGEEAVASGVIPFLHPEDAIIATYREHGHALIRGISAKAIMAEMYGKVQGCSRGRGGSMHLYDAKTRFYGGNAIVGGSLPLATGLALADKMQNKKQVTAAFFGEGAMAEGEFHEAANLAALWRLPVLFLCENNLYAMGTALARSESQVDLCAKVRAYLIPAESVDGMRILNVAEAAEKNIKLIREEGGPRFLEFRTYRFRPHSMFDPDLYREKTEIEDWKKRDPIPFHIQLMNELGWLDEKKLEALEKEIAREVAEAVAFAEAGTWESFEDLIHDVYTPRPAQGGKP